MWKLINLNNSLEVFIGDVVKDKNGLSYIVMTIHQPVNNTPQKKISYKKLTKSGIKESNISKFNLEWKWIQ